MNDNNDVNNATDCIADACFGLAFFCGSVVATLTLYYIAACFITIVALPLITAPRSSMLRSIGVGALLGIAAVLVIGYAAHSFTNF